LQATHGPAHVELQQTLSVQIPDAHWQPFTQDEPGGRSATQVLLEHQAPSAQLPGQPRFGVQDVLQAPAPLHVKMPQPASGSVPAGRFVHVPPVPARLQATQGPEQRELQQTPSVQYVDVHSTPSAQVAPAPFFSAHPDAEQYWVPAQLFTSAGQARLVPPQLSA
jgi:hypothetical protein